MPNEKKAKNAGIGVVAQSENLIFTRTFRFTLKSDKDDRVVHFVTKAHANFKLKILTLAVYETVYIDDLSSNPALEYVTSMLNDETDSFTLTTYDGCGHVLTEHRFVNAKLVDHDTFFDYASSDAVTHTLTLSYEDRQTKHVAHIPSDPVPMGAIPKNNHVEKTA